VCDDDDKNTTRIRRLGLGARTLLAHEAQRSVKRVTSVIMSCFFAMGSRLPLALYNY